MGACSHLNCLTLLPQLSSYCVVFYMCFVVSESGIVMYLVLRLCMIYGIYIVVSDIRYCVVSDWKRQKRRSCGVNIQ